MADVQLMLTPRSEGPDLEERDYYGLNTVLSVSDCVLFAWLEMSRCVLLCVLILEEGQRKYYL